MNRSASEPGLLQPPSSASSRNSRGDRPRKSGTVNMLGAIRPREARRALLETLSDPDVEDTAKEIFNQFDTDNSGAIDIKELMSVLENLHKKLGIQPPKTEEIE